MYEISSTSDILIAALPKNSEDSDDDLLHVSVWSRKHQQLLDDDLICCEELHVTVVNMSSLTTSACQADIESDRIKKKPKEFMLVGIPHVVKVKKTKEDSASLPKTFPLPTNFRPDVHVCLSNRKMTRSVRAAYFTSVAAAMFQY